jgi:hypothetical protein
MVLFYVNLECVLTVSFKTNGGFDWNDYFGQTHTSTSFLWEMLTSTITKKSSINRIY